MNSSTEECEIELSEKTIKKLEKLLKELQKKGKDLKTLNDVIIYLLDHAEKQGLLDLKARAKFFGQNRQPGMRSAEGCASVDH